MQVHFPKWKYALLLVVLLVSLFYALPNMYGEDPSVQISSLKGDAVPSSVVTNIEQHLQDRNLLFKGASQEDGNLLIRFDSVETQLTAKDQISALLGGEYSVALNLAPAMPKLFSYIGAEPMKLGLDLRGGLRFLMEVDIQEALDRRLDSYLGEIRTSLRQDKLNYSSVHRDEDFIKISFANEEELNAARFKLKSAHPVLDIKMQGKDDFLTIQLSQVLVTEIRNYTMEQTASTLRNRINELGVAEAIVQRQGLNRVVVELPGIQDTARAKDILGKTATLDFVMKDMDNDPYLVASGNSPTPVGSKLLQHKEGYPILVNKKVILTGDSIVGASSALDSEEGKPIVQIKLGGKGLGAFKSTTKRNVNKFMAVIYRETKMQDKVVNGEIVSTPVTTETVISDARILQPLGASFQISGLGMKEARELALLLRSGALPATVSIVEEKIVGPSLGQENIEMGMISLAVGLSLVLIFMGCYYSLFGLVANIGLLFNLVLLVALMSMIGATLTLPGLAGIVLTLGMAVDANVLIFERIREELRNGVSPVASIHRGFEHAFSTIVDANLTTLIVGIILFAVGTGPVKGFAVTLSIGILTSMFTAITGTRAMIEFLYGGDKEVKKLAVGI